MKLLVSVLLVLVLAMSAGAAEPLRVYVGDFNVVGVQSRDEIKAVLQSLLASRMGGERVLSVGSAAEAEVVVSGTYVAIGKQFNIDAVAKSASGQTVARSFVQGEGGQEVLFAVSGQLADKLSGELLKKAESGAIVRLPRVLTAPAQAVAARPVQQGDIVRNAVPVQSGDLQRVQQGDIVRPQAFYRGAPNKGEIKRLDAMYNQLAVGEAGADGKRLLFMAQNQSVHMLREGESRPISGFSVGASQKIIGLDYVDADGNGSKELYVTIVTNGELDSQVWELRDNRLVKVADGIPYYFRSIALAGGQLKLYAQEQGKGEEQFYGDVYEVVRQGKKIVKKSGLVMPRFGNIYSFNQFKHESGELLTVVFHPNNYLVVYDKDHKELWRSNDAFGGSELYYQVEDKQHGWATGDNFRWFFINQRIQVTSKQEVLVGKNDGFWVLGNARMYKRGAVYSLYWNGAALEEVWRTKDTQNYMPDYYFDEARSELLLLQLTQREDLLTRAKGATALQIKKVE